jgi:hypothetical protein
MSQSAEDIHFRPFTVLLGIIMGTVFSIAFGLAVVCFVFWVLRDEEPRVAAEFGSLLISTGIFVTLSCCAGLSFYGSLWQYSWRYAALAMLWLGLLLTGWYYWP